MDIEKYSKYDLSFFDFAEHHIWMVKENNGEFYREVNERSQKAGRPVDNDGLFSNQVYKNLVAEYEGIYNEKPEYWKKLLTDKIILAAEHTAKAKLPLLPAISNEENRVNKWIIDIAQVDYQYVGELISYEKTTKNDQTESEHFYTYIDFNLVRGFRYI